MKEYYKSTRLARLLTKFVMQDISEGEKKELGLAGEESGCEHSENYSGCCRKGNDIG